MSFQSAICQADSISLSKLPLCMADLSAYLIYGSLAPLGWLVGWGLTALLTQIGHIVPVSL